MNPEFMKTDFNLKNFTYNLHNGTSLSLTPAESIYCGTSYLKLFKIQLL